MSNQFVWKPKRENGPNAVAVIPSQYTGQTAAVYLVDAQGNTIAQGKYRSSGNGNRGNWDFPKYGGAYGSNVQVVVKLENGSTVGYKLPNAGSRVEARSETGSGEITGEQSTFQGTEVGSGAGTVGGNQAGQFITGPGGTQVFVPNFVNFDPTQFYISYDEANQRAEQRADKNVDRFQENFSLAEKLTAKNLNTEITALEAYLPRSTALIRNADAQGNRDILAYSDAFDQRNLSATKAASSSNVEARKGYLDETVPGLFESGNAVRDRLEGDTTRIRERESQPLIADPLKETAARSARNMAADRGAAGGMGIDSTATRNLIDRFDFDKRLEVETANREDARKGDTAIQSSETAVLNANQQAASNFNSLIAPGIVDFNPIQAAPRVTDVASQIKASPTTDAATIQRGFANDLTPLTTMTPTQAFANSFEEQKNNRQLDLQALQFQQQQNDIIASAVNESSDLVVSENRYQDQRALFEQALEQRRNGENIQGGTALVTAGLGVLGGLISDYRKNPTAANQSAVGGFSNWVAGILGDDWKNEASQWVNENFGVDLGTFDSNASDSGFWNEWGTADGQPSSTSGFNDGSGGSDPFSEDPFADLASSSNYGPTTYDDSGNFNFASDEGKSLVKRSLSKNTFEGSSELNDQFSSLPDDQQEQYLANLNSFAEGMLLPENRDTVAATLGEYGLSPATIAQAYNLVDNWEGMNDRDRAFATASVLNNISTTMGNQVIPGYAMAFVNAVRQGANLYSNWDNMTDGERAEAGTNIAGGIAGAGATYMAAASGAGLSSGPIGMAVAVAFMSVARSTRIAIDEGFSNRANDAAITSPYQSFAHQVVTPYLDSKGVPDILNPAAFLSEQDRDNAALLNGYAPFLGVHSMLGGDMDFTSGKGKDQQYRDYFRDVGADPKLGSFLQKNEKGSHELTLADGSKFDIGKDGGAKLKNYGTNIDGKTERQYSDVDWSNPQANEIVAIANPLSVLIFRSSEGKRMVGHLSNAISSNNPTDLKAIKSNAKHVALQAGMDYATGVLGLQKLKEEKSISEGTYKVYLKSWQDIMLR
jgi:hypothetical protein